MNGIEHVLKNVPLSEIFERAIVTKILEFLNMKTICSLYTISTFFQRCCDQALINMKHINLWELWAYHEQVLGTIQSKSCKNLTSINFAERCVTQEIVSIVELCKNLQKVHILAFREPHTHVEILTHLAHHQPYLSELRTVYTDSLSSSGIQPLADRCQQLRKVWLNNGTRTKMASAKGLYELLKRCKNLRQLYLYKIGTGEEVENAFERLKDPLKLTRVELPECDVGDRFCDLVPRILPDLQVLNLQVNKQISDEGIVLLTYGAVLDLRALDLTFTNISRKCEKIFEDLRIFPNLSHLRIDYVHARNIRTARPKCKVNQAWEEEFMW